MMRIDLHLPTGWDRCSTEELEAIAAAIVEEQASAGRYRPFNWERVKLNVVLAINSLSVNEELRVKNKEFATATDSDTYLVCRPQDKEPWPISTGQLCSLCEMLNWLTDEKASKVIFQFPYPTLDVRCKKEEGRRKREGNDSGSKFFILHSSFFTLQGPPPLLDGYTWREYRWLTDWMQEYMRCANALAQMKNEELRMKNQEAAEQAQREFLAVLFKPKDDGTAVANSSFFTLHSSFFEGFSPVKWQVILFWWSSLMWQLAKKFPRVFKSQPVGKGKRQRPDMPWDFYNRVTATVQKYVGGLSAQDVDAQPYGVVLQQLEMMADEAAELEKMKHKK